MPPLMSTPAVDVGKMRLHSIESRSVFERRPDRAFRDCARNLS